MDDKHETSEKVRRLEIELAFARGSKIQYQHRKEDAPTMWYGLRENLHKYKFDWLNYDYRLAADKPTSTTPENDPIANGHNPAGLRRSQIDPANEGWRLLSLKEVADQAELQHDAHPFFSDTQHFDSDKNRWSVTGTYMAYGRTINNTGTLRTKRPAGFYEKRVVKRPLRGDDFNPDKIYQVRHDVPENMGPSYYLVQGHTHHSLVFDECHWTYAQLKGEKHLQIREFPAGQWRPMYVEETVINDGRKV